MRPAHSLLLAALVACGLSLGARSLPAGAAQAPRVNPAAILGTGHTDGEARQYPRTLAEYGFFTDRAGRDPAPGLIPYELGTPLFSDGADKLRYLHVPAGGTITADGDGLLQFPVGSAIIKTFAFGEGADQRYIETRVLLHRADGWLALPYMWNAEQTEARLALVGGRVPITTPAGEAISYQVPNKNQCKNCHQLNGVVTPIGPKARNLAPAMLATLAERGFLAAVPQIAAPLPVWSARANAGSDTPALARAYLDVNCAHCHQPGGSASNSGLDLRWEQESPHAIGINKPPVAAGRGSGGRLVSILPGDPDASILVHRMSSTEPGVAMPELGRATNDADGIAVVRAWIEAMDAAP